MTELDIQLIAAYIGRDRFREIWADEEKKQTLLVLVEAMGPGACEVIFNIDPNQFMTMFLSLNEALRPFLCPKHPTRKQEVHNGKKKRHEAKKRKGHRR